MLCKALFYNTYKTSRVFLLCQERGLMRTDMSALHMCSSDAALVNTELFYTDESNYLRASNLNAGDKLKKFLTKCLYKNVQK